jgi:hypothetical protein
MRWRAAAARYANTTEERLTKKLEAKTKLESSKKRAISSLVKFFKSEEGVDAIELLRASRESISIYFRLNTILTDYTVRISNYGFGAHVIETRDDKVKTFKLNHAGMSVVIDAYMMCYRGEPESIIDHIREQLDRIAENAPTS